jgi:Ala-tRNA(Pro) deacylase
MGASAISHADPLLLEWLGDHDVEYEVHEHAPAFTARGVAKAEGVDPHTFAKVVAVRATDGRRALIVLETTDQLDLRKAARTLGSDTVRLLTEAELAILAPTCELGAVPAVGSLFEVPMVADYAVRDDRDISFNAGSHRCSVRVERAGWERATGVVYADLAADHDDRPVWAQS